MLLTPAGLPRTCPCNMLAAVCCSVEQCLLVKLLVQHAATAAAHTCVHSCSALHVSLLPKTALLQQVLLLLLQL